MPSNTQFLPLHVNCIANDCSLFMLFIIMKGSCLIHTVYNLSILYTVSFLPPSLHQPQFCFLSLVDCFFHSHLIFYARVLKFLCSVEFLTVSIFLIAISSLICSYLLFRTSSFHFCVSMHFKNRWDSLSSPVHWRHLPLPLSQFNSFSFLYFHPEPCCAASSFHSAA